MLTYLTGLNSIFAHAESLPIRSGSERRLGTRALILAAFFLSGSSGLIYQVIWSRMLSLVFGSTTFAVATVLTAFMAGMALGGFYFGRFIDRRGNPLKVYAYLQAGIGIFAILLPLVLSGVTVVYIALHRALHTSFYVLSFVKFVLCFAAIIIPTTLMGGTLPVLSKFFSNRMNRLGWNIGLLYAVNTFGAVLGCFLTGFVLIRTIGVSGTIYLAVAINVLIASGILFLSRSNSNEYTDREGNAPRSKPVFEENVPEFPGWVGRLALCVIAVSGFCALAYEVLWTRVLSLFLGSTTYAFTTMLTTFLCGIALGSFIVARFVDSRKDLLTVLGMIQMGIAVSAVLMIPVYGKLYFIGQTFTRPGWWTFIRSRFTLSFLIMILPTMLMGATFPLISKIYTRSLRSLGSSIGNVYSVNTLGSIFGSFLAGFIFIPHIGIQISVVLVAFLNAAVGAMVIVVNVVNLAPGKRSYSNVLRISLLAAAVFVIAVASMATGIRKHIISHTAIFKGAEEENPPIFYDEGIDACVTVVKDRWGVKRAFVDTNQAAEDSRWDLPSHSIIGHLPILLHPDPKTALVIGFGMGVTSWSISRHGVEVDAVEISPGIVEANKEFTDVNHNVLDDPLVKLIVDDGRNYILTTDKKYDMISTGIIHPLVSSNSAGFYTLDLYELCKGILTEDGIMCQWVPLHGLPEEHYKMIVRTFKKAFPHTTLWHKYWPDFSILIGTPEPLKIDYLDFKRRMEKESVKADLALVNMDDPITLLDTFMMDEDTIGEYVGDGPLHTDDRPRMEFFGTNMRYTTIPNIKGMKGYRKSVVPFLTNMGEDEGYITDMFSQYSLAAEYVFSGHLDFVEAAKYVSYADSYYKIGEHSKALEGYENAKKEYIRSMEQYRSALEVTPQDSSVRWLIDHLQDVMYEQDIEILEGLAEAEPASPSDLHKTYEIHFDLGEAYRGRGLIDAAINAMKFASQLEPDQVPPHVSLSNMYLEKGMKDKAVEELKAAIKLDPDTAARGYINLMNDIYQRKGTIDSAIEQLEVLVEAGKDLDSGEFSRYIAFAHINTGSMYREKGMIDKAIKELEAAIRLDPKAALPHISLGDIHWERGMIDEAINEYEVAIELDPTVEYLRFSLSDIYRQKGMLDKAIYQLTAIVEKAGTNDSLSMAHGRLGDLYREKGDFSRSEEEFKAALAINPNSPLPHYSLAVLYLDQGIKLDEALEHAKKAADLSPEPRFIVMLAGLYYENGKYSDAKREIERAIALDPDNENYQAMLAEIRKKLGG